MEESPSVYSLYAQDYLVKKKFTEQREEVKALPDSVGYVKLEYLC